MTKPWIMIDFPANSEADCTLFGREALVFLISASICTPYRFPEAKKTGVNRKPNKRDFRRKNLLFMFLFLYFWNLRLLLG